MSVCVLSIFDVFLVYTLHLLLHHTNTKTTSVKVVENSHVVLFDIPPHLQKLFNVCSHSLTCLLLIQSFRVLHAC